MPTYPMTFGRRRNSTVITNTIFIACDDEISRGVPLNSFVEIDVIAVVRVARYVHRPNKRTISEIKARRDI